MTGSICAEDIRIARRLARRYYGNKRFNHEDAEQAALESLLRAGVPENEGLRVLAMKNGIARQVTMAVFPVCIPRSSYDKMRKEGKLPGVVGNDIQVDQLVFDEKLIEHAFTDVEDSLLVDQMLAKLNESELRVVKTFMQGKRFAYRSRDEDKQLLEQTLKEIRLAELGAGV